MPVDGTFPTGTPSTRSATSPRDPDLGPGLCIQCGKCALVCPHAAIRAKVYDEPNSWNAPRPSSRPTTRARTSGHAEVHDPGRAGGLHRLRAVRRRLPGQGQEPTPSARRSTWSPSCRSSSRSGRTTTSSSTCPSRPDASSSIDTVKGSQFLRAAVRVLRRLRRLRRDALRQAAHPALRRPHADRQRDRLLVDLRRQPADHALHADRPTGAAPPGPTRCSRTTPSSARHAPRGRQADRAGARAGASCRRDRRRPGRGMLEADQSRRGRHRRAARTGRVALRGSSLGDRRAPKAKLCAARRLPGQEERLDRRRRRLGLRHRLRRPRPRAGPGATSTSWCSTPRSTPTPAARPPRPPHRRVAKFAAAGKPTAQEGPGHDGHGLRQRLRRQRRDGRQGRQTVKAFSRPRATPARR
jgi:ferredoxin